MCNKKSSYRFRAVDGITVDINGITECYSVKKSNNSYYHFVINISAENIEIVFKKLIQQVKTPGFFLFEIGTNIEIEKELRKSKMDPLHKDVYYLDGIDVAKATEIFKENSDLMINDGMINVGFGSHEGTDEVLIGSYKIFEIYTDNPNKYQKVLDKFGIPLVDTVKTVWKNFNNKNPGKRFKLEDRDNDIYGMIEKLKSIGFYLAERRED